MPIKSSGANGIALLSLGLLIRFKVNSTWLILGGAMTGVLKAAFD
jgi:hypothetical protein